MPRAINPASPLDEVAQRQRVPRYFRQGNPLTAELVDFMQSGISIILGSVAEDGTPVPGRAQGCIVEKMGTVRITIEAGPYGPLLRAVTVGRPLAVTFSRPEDHRSIQLKSASARLSPLQPQDRDAAIRQASGLSDQLVILDYARAFSDAYVTFDPDDLAVIEFSPEQAFVQTPGPGAGTELQP